MMRKRASPHSGNVRNRREAPSSSSSFHEEPYVSLDAQNKYKNEEEETYEKTHSKFHREQYWEARQSYAAATSHHGTPLFVPDKQYYRYISGESSRNKSWFDSICCARGCAGFSLVAILFLLFVGVLVDRQPLYIKGIRIKEPASNVVPRHSYALASVVVTNAHHTATVYFIVLLISLGYGWNLCWRIRAYQRRLQYSDIPDTQSATSMDSTLPIFHDVGFHRRTKHTAHLWERMMTGWKKSRPKKPKRG